MVTNVKMHVTPDLSERVQEIVFAHGGGWLDELEAKIKYLTAPYIYLDCNKRLIYGTLISNYKIHDFKEVLAYDFIASQGEQEWLPKYGEKALFGENFDIALIFCPYHKFFFFNFILKNNTITANISNFKKAYRIIIFIPYSIYFCFLI